MLLADGLVELSRGPRENSSRPAIDPLFRSAAAAFGQRVMGVVLSGNLDDGSAGLRTVSLAGGLPVVQDPNEALHPEMPRNAILTVPESRVGTVEAIATAIVRAAHEEEEDAAMPLERDGQVYFANPAVELGARDAPGSPTGLTCPECHGVLWFGPEASDAEVHCRTGHKFTLETLQNEQRTQVENAMWAAVRALQEESTLAHTIAVKAETNGRASMARRFFLREETARRHAGVLQRLLMEEVPEATAGE
jgi:two-component system chemotaxis response regulator CheB